jgi:hypothetical protein
LNVSPSDLNYRKCESFSLRMAATSNSNLP